MSTAKSNVESWGRFYVAYDPEKKTSLAWECPSCNHVIDPNDPAIKIVGFEANPPIIPSITFREKTYAVVVTCLCGNDCWFHTGTPEPERSG